MASKSPILALSFVLSAAPMVLARNAYTTRSAAAKVRVIVFPVDTEAICVHTRLVMVAVTLGTSGAV
jgi:hypothetical protein